MTGRQVAVSLALVGTLPVLAFLAPRATGHAQAEMPPLYGDELPLEEVLHFPLVTPTVPVPAIKGRTLLATVTGYCLRGAMRSGRQTYLGAVATDPRVIPLGSRLQIDGLGGTYVAEDTGAGVIGDWVDVWFETCGAALDWGRQTRTVTVLP